MYGFAIKRKKGTFLCKQACSECSLFYIADSQTRTFGALLSASQTVCSLMAQEKQMAAYAAACFSFAPITS